MIKRDSTEPAITRMLRELGADYLRLGPFDLLVWFRNQLYMFEVKAPAGRPTKRQRELMQRGWPLYYVRTPADVMRVLGLGG